MTRLMFFLRQLLREFSRTLLAITIMVSSGAMLMYSQDDIKDKVAKNTGQDGWGSEALSQVYEGLNTISPVSLANACGLGASSCFKCHNDKRAKAANMNSEEAPWHSDHEKVNNSCAGCHKGNPRLMKEKMAHSRMLKKVNSSLKKACSKCHSDAADLNELAKNYTSIGGN